MLTSSSPKRGPKREILVNLRLDPLFAFALVCLVSSPAYAQTQALGVSRPLILLLVLAALALVPFVIMMATSFVKLAVVLALIRNALGTQQVPPNVVVTGLALILTVYIMAPVGIEVYEVAKTTINQGTNQPLLSQASVELLAKASKEGKEPVRDFLLRHAHASEQELFYNLAVEMRRSEEAKAAVGEKDFLNVIPAFVISELTEAFQIGFVIFLPFLIIDLVIANILLSLGMFQISPVTLSLPFKLLLFVMVDGWHLIVKGLIQGYV
ncbi:MAG: type III secretion system export apparatus subunit SctR [Deltaproteobacteria bacterium]|nr:type III secretion system export apparatus subunit SctR [Deltaproteobacteria bacterium]